MNKRRSILLTIILILVVTFIIIYLNWGEYEHKLEKTEIIEVEDSTDAQGYIQPSLDDLEGLYKVDAETGKAEILFQLDGLKNTRGGFEKFIVNFTVPDDFTQSKLEVIVDVSSIKTGNSMRDEHVMDSDFFNEAEFPEIHYLAEAINFSEGHYEARGVLELLGEANELDFIFDHKGGQDLADSKRIEVFEGEFVFDRTAYGMEESTGVGNDVSISFYVELEKDQSPEIE